MMLGSQGGFRAALLGFAVVLEALAVWIIVPEIARQPTAIFSVHSTAGESAAARKSAARWAARSGVVRGDLWVDFALTYSDFLAAQGFGRTPSYSREAIEEARATAERALRLSPHDARIWLLLAALDTRIERLNHDAAAALKMSYYTGSNEPELIPWRLIVAVRPGVLADDELQQLFRHELHTIVSRKPALKPAIVTAYREADPAARRLMEAAISDHDPALLGSLRQ